MAAERFGDVRDAVAVLHGVLAFEPGNIFVVGRKGEAVFVVAPVHGNGLVLVAGATFDDHNVSFEFSYLVSLLVSHSLKPFLLVFRVAARRMAQRDTLVLYELFVNSLFVE